MTGDTITAEEVERDLARAKPYLETAAGELSEGGHVQAAEALREVAGIEELGETCGNLLYRLENMPKAERDLAMYGLYDVARGLRLTGDERYDDTVVRLAELLEQVGEVFGLPDEAAA